jgi:putative transcriptional regulator
MSILEYMSDVKDIAPPGRGGARPAMIDTRIDELLEERGRTFYWLAKETGISHTTLWRLKKGKALGINFGTLEGICLALGCQPGDVLRLSGGVKKKGSSRSKTAGRKS